MELQRGRAYQPWFLIGEKGRPARTTQVCKVNSLFFFFFYLLGSAPACIVRWCSSMVAIVHMWFMCEQEWVRWEVSPGFWYSSVQQLCVQVPHMLSRAHLLTDAHSLPAFKYMHKCSFFMPSDSKSSIKPSTDHTHLCLLYRCGWCKGRQCVVRSLSSPMWGAGGLADWDPRLAYCDKQPAWRLGESSKTNLCKNVSSACWHLFVVFSSLTLHSFGYDMSKKMDFRWIRNKKV